MDTSIIITLILASAGLISAFLFGYLPRVRKNKVDALNRKISTLSRDLQFFHELEILFLAEIERLEGKASKKRYRDKISEKIGHGPSTDQEPRRLKENIINK